MDFTPSADFKNRLQPQVAALVAKATGGTDAPLLVETVLEACNILEATKDSAAPLVAIERDVRLDTGTYHLSIRRLSTSVPPGKFQILISRELASGLVY